VGNIWHSNTNLNSILSAPLLADPGGLLKSGEKLYGQSAFVLTTDCNSLLDSRYRIGRSVSSISSSADDTSISSTNEEDGSGDMHAGNNIAWNSFRYAAYNKAYGAKSDFLP